MWIPPTEQSPESQEYGKEKLFYECNNKVILTQKHACPAHINSIKMTLQATVFIVSISKCKTNVREQHGQHSCAMSLEFKCHLSLFAK